MEKLEVGDVVICIKVGALHYQKDDSGYPLLRLHAEYIVQKLHICECDRVSIDVGLASREGRGTSCSCGAITSPRSAIHWCAAERFIKKKAKSESKEEIEENIKKAVESEDYELATELREKLKMVEK